MAQIRNKQDIKYSIEDEVRANKKLPNFFLYDDEISPVKGLSLSVLTHIVFIILMFYMQTFVFSLLPKPQLPTRDIEFKLVEAPEQTPINKKTKNVSDRNSRAGGKHDPKKVVSEPGRTTPIKKSKPAAPAPKPEKKVVQKPLADLFKQNKPQPQQKVVQKPQPTQITKPSKVSAPSAVKPNIKPNMAPKGVSTPMKPKIATAPKNIFNVPVAPSNAPIGAQYKPQGVPGGSSGSYKGTSSGGNGAPAPKFSTSGGSSRGTTNGTRTAGSAGSAGSYASRGGSGGGSGSGNNPSPGNPNGRPGIDAVRQPNWGPYMRDLEQRIKRNWSPPKGDSSKRVIVTFSIAKDGRLLSKSITKSSGSPLADQAAINAIQATAPFKPLPPEFRGSSVPIEFTFDYNVLNGATLR